MKLRFAALLLALSLALGLCALPAVAEESIDLMSLYKIRDTDAAWSAANAIAVDLNSVTGNNVTLTAAGDYVLSGSYSGQVVVEAPEDAKVRLILNGVSIVSPEGPAIYEKQANKLIVTLAENTRNTLTDGPAVADGDDTIGAALYAEDDLSVNGSGALTVTGTAGWRGSSTTGATWPARISAWSALPRPWACPCARWCPARTPLPTPRRKSAPL